MYEYLLVERNENWLEKINHMLLDPKVEFVLVGSLHMAGKEGLISMLRQQGVTIEQLD